MKKAGILATLFVWAFVLNVSVGAQRPFRLRANHFTGFTNPIFLTHAGDRTRRIFVVERGGTVRVAQPGSTTFTTYLTRSVSTDGERGLLGLAFHPDFETTRRVFIYYTRPSDGAIEIAEFEQSLANPNTATFLRVIITIPHAGASNHNGGTIAFGPDGFLYAAPGDGGGGNDPNGNAQNINSLLGKMLRLDINTPLGQSPAYNIPPGNPYAGVGVAGADEIYAIGLRNPFRFAFDRGGTNQLWVADVGQGAWEEVSIVTAGGNYGWRVYEGAHCTGLDPGLCSTGGNPINHTPPIFEYSSASPSSRCSITGGTVYRGTQNALPQGSYIYGDYCTGEILLWHQNQQTLLADTGNSNLAAFGEDEDGEIYVVRLNGNIDKVMGVRTNGDFDGDSGTDVAVYRPSNGAWYSLNPLNFSVTANAWGASEDIPVADDYDGDGKSDHAVFRPSNGVWYVLRSSNATVMAVSWGLGTDTPAVGDYDGDGRADLTVYRDGNWYTLRSSDSGVTVGGWGMAGDIPVNADYSGDGRDDLAVYRPSVGAWYGLNSGSGEVWVESLGSVTDTPVPGDYDGDGKVDAAVFNTTTGTWQILKSSDRVIQVGVWGLEGDIPVPGDYDRDHRDDIAVFRPGNATWYILRSSNFTAMVTAWGVSTDLPVTRYDRP